MPDTPRLRTRRGRGAHAHTCRRAGALRAVHGPPAVRPAHSAGRRAGSRTAGATCRLRRAISPALEWIPKCDTLLAKLRIPTWRGLL